MMRTNTIILLIACLAPSLTTNAFQAAISRVAARNTAAGDCNWPLGAVIKSEELDVEFDVGRGGVRLTQESVIKMQGDVKHKPGSASPRMKDLLRYTGVTLLEEIRLLEQLKTMQATVVCTGEGKEMYKDPGESLDTLVVLAPMDAVRDALKGAGSAMKADHLVINVAGGDDLQVNEVISALEELVLDLDLVTKAKISFNSLSHSTFPNGYASVTAIALPEGASAGGKAGTEKSIAQGEVYASKGKWYTVVEQDIENAVA
jgi:hypothetical protein